jgi:glycosyltransferase involved in cell wall biosynthesis
VKPVVWVVTTVHWPDDTRIRERLIRTLAGDFDVVYLARTPGPTDRSGVEYVELRGGRLRRNLQALRLALTGDWQVLVVNDPELMLCALLARLVRRRPVVFDVHEDVPASAYTRAWVPRWARRALSRLMVGLLGFVERFVAVTLAEPGYQHLFSRPHPVFPNYPDTTHYPPPGGDEHGPVVYLGDMTYKRGVDVAIAACSSLGVPLRLIGRVSSDIEDLLRAGTPSGDGVIVDGSLPNPIALERLAQASVAVAPLRDLPNYRHSQPTKVLEYLAMGLPVVASDLPGTRSLVADLEAVILVEPDDPSQLATAISKARTPDVARQAREQAADIRSRFRWPEAEVQAFYKSLL